MWRVRRHILNGANLAAPVVAAGLLASGRPAAAVTVLGSAHMAWLASTLVPNFPWSGEVVGRRGFGSTGPDGGPQGLWLTIDDGPSRLDHDALLRMLERAGVRASCFVIGRNAGADPDMVREWHAAGHRIENHTWSHASGSTWIAGPGRARDEVNRCQDCLGEMLGREPRWFRAPAGLTNPWLHAAVERRGLKTLAWTARGFDAGLARDPEAVVKRIRARLRPGGIVLIHQGTSARDGKPLAPQVLERLLDAAAEDGYLWARPDEAASALGLTEG